MRWARAEAGECVRRARRVEAGRVCREVARVWMGKSGWEGEAEREARSSR